MSDMLQGSLAELTALHRASVAGDTEAAAWFASLFGPDDRCWLCDQPGEDFIASIIVDPTRPPDGALIAPECRACHLAHNRPARVLKMLKSMWPAARWKTAAEARRAALHRRR